jgi:hypothetical protein
MDAAMTTEAGVDVASPPSEGSSPQDAASKPPADAADGAGDRGVAEAGPDTSTPPVDAGRCAPMHGNGGLPFVVDSVFLASGFMGDANQTTTDATCGGIGRSSANAQGSCHIVTYVPGLIGWSGVYWQYPMNNWGQMGGYAIPPGAKKVSFWARGAAGGEQVSFVVGYTGAATPADPCTDSVNGTTHVVTLTATWTQYAVGLVTAGGVGETYPNGVLGAFGWVANAHAPQVKFYLDDIQYM